MVTEKRRAFDAISAVVNHFSKLARLYEDGRADSGDHDDQVEARAARRTHRKALGGEYSREELATKLTAARTAAAAAGIPFEQLEQRLRAVTDIAGPIFSVVRDSYDESLLGRLQYELNQLIGLRDFYTLDAVKAAAGQGGEGSPPSPTGLPSVSLRRINAYLTEVRKVEAEWFSELARRQQGFVVGSSPWTGQSALLNQIKANHAFAPDDVLVRSITACIREREQLDTDRKAEMRQRNWPPDDPDCVDYHDRESWFDFLNGNCLVRNIPRQCLKPEDICTPAELWAFITGCSLPVRRILDRRSRERPVQCPEDVERIYAAMHRIGLDAPGPPFQSFTEAEAAIELQRIANSLERADRERYEAAIAEETARAKATQPRPDADTNESAYDPSADQPRTYWEWCRWEVAWDWFERGRPNPTTRPPVHPTRPDLIFLRAFCRDEFGASGREGVARLRDRFISDGRELTEVTPLRDIANHFRAQRSGAVPTARSAVEKPPAPSPVGGRLSRLDLPAIVQSVRDLYRAIENPPGTPFTPPEWWDRIPPELNCVLPETPAHSWLIGCAMQALQYRIQAGNLHDYRDCPEVADSDLDQRMKAKLLDLRENLCGAGRGFTSAALANSKSNAIQFKEYLFEVLRVIGQDSAPADIHVEAQTNRGIDLLEAPLASVVPAANLYGLRDEEPSPDATPNAEPDGPFDPDGFRFSGVPVRFGRAAKQFELVRSLWDRENCCPTAPRPVEDVIEAVYGESHETSDPAFRQLCTDTRRRFQAANCPVDVRSVQGKVQLVRLEPPRPA
jgi:hypothetical protein